MVEDFTSHRVPESHDDLERRLRHLPPPNVPEGLEARLLAQIMLPRSARRRTAVRRRWSVAAVLGAAAAVLVAGVVLLREPATTPPATTPPPTSMSLAAIYHAIEREATAARLLASAEMLAQAPGGREDAMKIMSYVRTEYADTMAVERISAKGIQGKGDSL